MFIHNNLGSANEGSSAKVSLHFWTIQAMYNGNQSKSKIFNPASQRTPQLFVGRYQYKINIDKFRSIINIYDQ